MHFDGLLNGLITKHRKYDREGVQIVNHQVVVPVAVGRCAYWGGIADGFFDIHFREFDTSVVGIDHVPIYAHTISIGVKHPYAE